MVLLPPIKSKSKSKSKSTNLFKMFKKFKMASRRAKFERKKASFVTYDVDDPAFADLRQPMHTHDFSNVWDINYTRIRRPADFRIRHIVKAVLKRHS